MNKKFTKYFFYAPSGEINFSILMKVSLAAANKSISENLLYISSLACASKSFFLSNMTMKFSAMGNKKFILSPFIASTDVVLFFSLYMPSKEILKTLRGVMRKIIILRRKNLFNV